MFEMEYENFKARLRTANEEDGIRNESIDSPQDHPACIEVRIIMIVIGYDLWV